MKWARKQNLLWRSAPGYLVLGAIDGAMTEVGGPGLDVWELLDPPIDEDSLVTELAKLYREDRSIIEADVHRLLVELETAGYVHRAH